MNVAKELAKELAKPQASSHNTLATEPTVIDLRNPKDCQRLKSWCEFHWAKSIFPCLQNKNRVIFHECCVSFSKRAFSYKAGHPPEHSMSLKQLRPFKSDITSDSGFYDWLVGVLNAREAGGNKPVMPAMNSYHYHATSLNVDSLLRELQSLRIENNHLVEEYRRLKTQNDALINETDRLRLSTVTWYNKFNESLGKRQLSETVSTDTPSFETPRKKLPFTLSRASSPMNSLLIKS
jgi:FtsZ-binding cell division protein ZapB